MSLRVGGVFLLLVTLGLLSRAESDPVEIAGLRPQDFGTSRYSRSPPSNGCAVWTNGILGSTGGDCGAGGSPAFSSIGAATNTTAAMVVGTGASLATSGSGTIAATSAATATALASNPTDCSAGQYATAIAASGNLTCAQPAASEVSGLSSMTISANTASGNCTTKDMWVRTGTKELWICTATNTWTQYP